MSSLAVVGHAKVANMSIFCVIANVSTLNEFIQPLSYPGLNSALCAVTIVIIKWCT